MKLKKSEQFLEYFEDIVTVRELVVFTHCNLTFPNQKWRLETHAFII